jgi:adenosylhomocysteine nucleosidase
LLEYGITLPGLPQGICGSGDTFEMNHFCNDYNVIDMEGYALALTAMKERYSFSMP